MGYTIDMTKSINRNVKKPPTMSWSRQGSTMPFCENGDGVMIFAGHKVENFDDLPPHLIKIIEQNKDYEVFKNPPSGMEEVLELEAKFEAKIKARQTAAVYMKQEIKRPETILNG